MMREMRNMVTPGGLRMSVAMTNCGAFGWTSDRKGYRYTGVDPESGLAWPAMPDAFFDLACAASARADFVGFEPDACLVNCYEPGARLTLHQDKNERDLEAPIVSVSLGLPAVFLFGGSSRAERPRRIRIILGMSPFGEGRIDCVTTAFFRSPWASTQPWALDVST
jgi:alkylated DNA repair protein (DNA oxidative demethylase)